MFLARRGGMHGRDLEFGFRVLGVEVCEEEGVDGHQNRAKCFHARQTTKAAVNPS